MIRDRLDVFIETLENAAKAGIPFSAAITYARKALAQAEEEAQKMEDQIMEDIHYQDRYGKD